MGDSLFDFSDSMLVDEILADDLRVKRMHALRRGRIITDEELLMGDNEQEVEEREADAAEAGDSAGRE
eukprot:6947360-Prymnesium_polylepis.1